MISVGRTTEQSISNSGGCIDDNFLLQVKEKSRRGAMLDFALINKELVVSNVKFKGRLGCSDHEMVA